MRFDVRHLHSYAPRTRSTLLRHFIRQWYLCAAPPIQRFTGPENLMTKATSALSWPALTGIFVHSYFSLSPPFNNGPALHAHLSKRRFDGLRLFLFPLFLFQCIIVIVRLYIVAPRREPKVLKFCNPTVAHHVGQAHPVRRRDWAIYAGQPGSPRHTVKGHPIS